MFTKTSAIKKNQFFQSLQNFSTKKEMSQRNLHITNKVITNMICFNQPVYITAHSGISMLVVTQQLADNTQYEQFILHRTVKINPGTFFNYLSISNFSSITLTFDDKAMMTQIPLVEPWRVKRVEAAFTLEQIYALYYQIKEAPYHFKDDQHPYCELTIVEQGELETIVDGQRYVLEANDVMLYQSNQIHSQSVIKPGITTYITIMFEMNLTDEQFFNRIFSLNRRQLYQVEQLIAASNDIHQPYQNDLLLAQLKLLIISLIDKNETQQQTLRASTMKENYDDNLYQQLTNYIHEHPEISVDDLVSRFGISRSTLQLLFKRMSNQTPKNYIEMQRFKKARRLIQESSYTLQEISVIVGYASLAAFSRAFKKHFQQSPLQYAKTLYKRPE